jgi:uncharacterized phage infection (PIP) family protein YhgE
MSIEQDFIQIQKTVQTLQQNIDRAKGGMAQIRKQLKEEFNCSTLKEAETLLEKITQEETQLSQQLEKQIQEFKKQYGHLLQTNEAED